MGSGGHVGALMGFVTVVVVVFVVVVVVVEGVCVVGTPQEGALLRPLPAWSLLIVVVVVVAGPAVLSVVSPPSPWPQSVPEMPVCILSCCPCRILHTTEK